MALEPNLPEQRRYFERALGGSAKTAAGEIADAAVRLVDIARNMAELAADLEARDPDQAARLRTEISAMLEKVRVVSELIVPIARQLQR